MSALEDQAGALVKRDRARLEIELHAPLGVDNTARVVAAIDSLIQSEIAMAFARFAANMKGGR